MPVRNVDFDRFEYRFFDEEPLSLEDAVKKAVEKRRSDASAVYRIVPNNEEPGTFRVEQVPAEEAYAEFLGRINERWMRFLGFIGRSRIPRQNG